MGVFIDGVEYSIRTALNKLNWLVRKGIYASFKDAIIDKVIGHPPKCRYCENEVDIFDIHGWGQRCSDISCKDAAVAENIRNTLCAEKATNLAFRQHLLDNFHIYESLINSDSDVVIFPFTRKSIKRTFVLSYIKKFFTKEDYEKIKRTTKITCLCCGKVFAEHDVLDMKTAKSFCSKVCAGYYVNNNGATKSEINDAKISKFISETPNSPEFDISKMSAVSEDDPYTMTFYRKYDKIVFGTHNGSRVPLLLSEHIDSIVMLCESQYLESGKSILEFISDSLDIKCDICGDYPKSITKIRNIYRNNDPKYCSKACYYQALRDGVYPASDETRARQSALMKNKILSGEFTPNATNSRCKSRIDIGENHFRSSWDVAFWLMHPSTEYETQRIRYFDSQEQKERVYIVDFIDRDARILYEIKPDEMRDDIRNIEKESAAISWCEENSYEIQVIGNDWICDNIDSILERANNYDDLRGKIERKLRKVKRSKNKEHQECWC